MTRARQAAAGLALVIAVAGCGSSAERPAAPQFGQVHAEPFPQAGMARLGHGDDAADLPAGDPAAIGKRSSC